MYKRMAVEAIDKAQVLKAAEARAETLEEAARTADEMVLLGDDRRIASVIAVAIRALKDKQT